MRRIQAFLNIITTQCHVVDTDGVWRLVKKGHLLLEYLQCAIVLE